MRFGKQKFDVKQLIMNKFIMDTKQLKMNKFMNSLRQLVISPSNTALEIPLLRPCLVSSEDIKMLQNSLFSRIFLCDLSWLSVLKE